jgi:hypothetical protein
MRSEKVLRDLLSLAVAVICCFTLGGLGGSFGFAQANHAPSVQRCDEMICIRSETAVLETDKPFRLFITIKNKSAAPLPLKYYPYLVLVKGDAPKHLEISPENGFYSKVSLPADSEFMTKPFLNPQQSMDFDLDMTQLQWGESSSAFRPSENLFTVVPEGKYSLYLKLQIEDADNSRQSILSNAIKVTRK